MSKDLKEFNDAIDVLHSIKIERDKLQAEVEKLKSRNIRMEKINQLCKELEYNITMGLEEGTVEPTLTFRSTIAYPLSERGKTYRQFEVRLSEVSWHVGGSGGSGGYGKW